VVWKTSKTLAYPKRLCETCFATFSWKPVPGHISLKRTPRNIRSIATCHRCWMTHWGEHSHHVAAGGVTPLIKSRMSVGNLEISRMIPKMCGNFPGNHYDHLWSRWNHAISIHIMPSMSWFFAPIYRTPDWIHLFTSQVSLDLLGLGGALHVGVEVQQWMFGVYHQAISGWFQTHSIFQSVLGPRRSLEMNGALVCRCRAWPTDADRVPNWIDWFQSVYPLVN